VSANAPLRRPAPLAVAAYARKLIAQAGKARRRISVQSGAGAGGDPVALHDFRVAIRRLRSHLRAYRDCHGVTRKAERRLRDLAAATGGGRNAEVALAWLEVARKELPDPAACDGLVGELTRERDAAYAHLGADLGKRWDEVATELRRRLARLPEAGAASFATAAEGRLRDHEARLKARLARVRTPADQDPAHRARIEAKRLRYLVEPLRGAIPGAAAVVRGLAAFQDTLGIMHDRQVMIGHLQTALRQAAAQGADRRLAAALGDGRMPAAPRPGDGADPQEAALLALARIAARERAERFAELKMAYLADRGARLLAPLDGLCAALKEAAQGG
jgi:CHAD domain-containing protein